MAEKYKMNVGIHATQPRQNNLATATLSAQQRNVDLSPVASDSSQRFLHMEQSAFKASVIC